MTKPSNGRRRRKPVIVNPWNDSEVKRLVQAYKAGRSRNEIANLLSRTSGSVANKIRILIQAGSLSARR
jgi:hypothetical protein